MRLAILGGGAAGLAAACAAAATLRACGMTVGNVCAEDEADCVDVVVYEADERVGRSILATGNGRCNFSNTHPKASLYRNESFVADTFASLSRQCAQQGKQGNAWRFGKQNAHVSSDNPVWAFFENAGLMWREESEGRLYPLANKATSVLDVLRVCLAASGARECCNKVATRIDVTPRADAPTFVAEPAHAHKCFHIRFADGSVEHADTVIVTVGGRAIERLGFPQDIVRVAPCPVLGPLRTDVHLTKQLNNIRVRCAVSLMRPGASGSVEQIAREEGEVLFRDYGVSGIAIFNLSRFAEPGDKLQIDFLPQVSADDMRPLLSGRRKRVLAAGGTATPEDVLRGMVLPQVARVIVQAADLRDNQPLTKDDLALLAHTLKRFLLTVEGVGDARQCQVTRGGIATSEVCPSTLEMREIPRLYVAGEALDIDAPCGGYNLHWAWASGLVAGCSAARNVCGCARDDRSA